MNPQNWSPLWTGHGFPYTSKTPSTDRFVTQVVVAGLAVNKRKKISAIMILSKIVLCSKFWESFPFSFSRNCKKLSCYMWCMQFIIIYDCNNYGNNNDNLDRAMNQSCSDFRIRNRAWTWIKNKALLIKVCVVNHLRVYLVHNFYYLGTMKFSFSLFLSFCIYLFIHQFINLGYFILFFFRFVPPYPFLT